MGEDRGYRAFVQLAKELEAEARWSVVQVGPEGSVLTISG